MTDKLSAAFQRLQRDLNGTEDFEACLRSAVQNFPLNLQRRLVDEFLGQGPLTDLLQCDGLTDIYINHDRSIWYQIQGKTRRHSDTFLSQRTFVSFIDRMCRQSQSVVTLQTPFCDMNWNGFRVHIGLHSQGFLLTFRKLRSSRVSLKQLIPSVEGRDIAEILVRDRPNCLVIGTAGAGKTSFLNTLLGQIQSEDRCILMEDTPELLLPNALSCKMQTRQVPTEIDHLELLRQALRMGPDRLIVGEIRGKEARDFLLTLSTGHRGSMATLHANDPHEAILRLQMLIQLGAPQWSFESTLRLIGLSLQYIVHVTREGPQRFIESISKVCSIEKTGVTLEKVYQKVPLTTIHESKPQLSNIGSTASPGREVAKPNSGPTQPI